MAKALIERNPRQLVQRVEAGVPFGDLEALGRSLDLPLEKLSSLLGIARATLHRRKQVGHLQPDESDRVVRYARLMGQAAGVFGSNAEALGWLRARQRGLGGAVPLDYARTEVGAREVEKLLGRIEHGVYT